MTISAYDPKLIQPLFPRFCPCQDCLYYLDKNNYITLDGTYPVKNDVRRRQRLYCHGGEHRFSETAYSDLFGHHGSFKEYVQTAKMSGYGLSTEQIADVLERDGRTNLIHLNTSSNYLYPHFGSLGGLDWCSYYLSQPM